MSHFYNTGMSVISFFKCSRPSLVQEQETFQIPGGRLRALNICGQSSLTVAFRSLMNRRVLGQNKRNAFTLLLLSSNVYTRDDVIVYQSSQVKWQRLR